MEIKGEFWKCKHGMVGTCDKDGNPDSCCPQCVSENTRLDDAIRSIMYALKEIDNKLLTLLRKNESTISKE